MAGKFVRKVADEAKSMTTASAAMLTNETDKVVNAMDTVKTKLANECARCHFSTVLDAVHCPKCGFLMHKVTAPVPMVINK